MSILQTRNPYTGEVIKTFDNLTHEEIDEKIEKSWQAFKKFRDTTAEYRIERLNSVVEVLEKNKHSYAELITLEMGKTIKQSRAEIDKCISFIKFYIENADKILSPEEVKTPADKSYIIYQPLGPLILFQPWNFPFWLVIKAVIPQLLIGNTMLTKNASNTPMCGRELENLFLEAGYEEGIYQYAPIKSSDGERVISDKRIRGCSLTGSGKSGEIIASLCGKYIKKWVMELGGADPFIVLDDADIEKAAKAGVGSRMNNNAQACTNAKRFIVHENVYEEFKEKIVQELNKLKIGDPALEDTDLGPLAKEDAVKGLKSQVQQWIDEGAKVFYGNKLQLTDEIEPSKGFFFTPMILEDIPHDCPAYNDELFGPVFCLFRVKNDQEAIDLANDHQYGLSGAVFSTDIERAEKVALQIDSGNVTINQISRSLRELPSGGVKMSGYGREGGILACREFVNIKSVVMFTK